MKHHFQVPPIMKELPLDERGYPIPFFVPMRGGKPEFRYQSREKQELALTRNLCSICGKKLYKGAYWTISGPIGFRNKVASDPPMHEDCARFSLTCCPHMLYPSAERRTEVTFKDIHVQKKPDYLILIKFDKFKINTSGPMWTYNYRHVYHEEYHYVDGKLTFSPPSDQP